MLRIKERARGALKLHELLKLIENAKDDDVIYHCYCSSKRPLKIRLKDLKPNAALERLDIIKNEDWGQLSHLGYVGCHLSEDNTYNDAYLFDNWIFAYAYIFQMEKLRGIY